MSPGDVVYSSSGIAMTVVRTVGDSDVDALKQIDQDLRFRGFDNGSPICDWFEGATLKSSIFHKLSVSESRPEGMPDRTPVAPPKPVFQNSPQPTSKTKFISHDDADFENEGFDD